jgi:GGDEF domain-containing protein
MGPTTTESPSIRKARPREQRRCRRRRRRVERLDQTVELSSSGVVIVEEPAQQRDDPSARAHKELAHVRVVVRVGGDEDAVLVEGAVGHEHVKVDVQLQRRAEALHEGDGAAGRLAQSTSPHAPPLPGKQHAQTRLQHRCDQVRPSAHREADGNGEREHPLPVRRTGQHAVDAFIQGADDKLYEGKQGGRNRVRS